MIIVDVLFKNTYTRDKKLVTEFCRHNIYKSPRTVVAYCLIAFLLVDCVFLMILQKSVERLTIYAFIIAVLCLGVIVWQCRRSIKLTLRRDLEVNHGKPMDITVIVTNDGIGIRNDTADQTISFDSIKKKVYQSKNLIYLTTNAKLAIVFDKHSFEIGSADELLSFLREKGYKIK